MGKPSAFAIAALVIASQIAVHTRADAGVSGAWSFTFTSPQEPTVEVGASLKQTDENVTGTIDLHRGGSAVIEGTLKGSNLVLSFAYPDYEPGVQITVTLSGKLKGDTIEGSADYETFGAGEWKGRREKTTEGKTVDR